MCASVVRDESCLGTQTRPDRLRGEPKQGEAFHALTPFAPTRVDLFQKSTAKSCKIGQRFIVANATRMDPSRR